MQILDEKAAVPIQKSLSPCSLSTGLYVTLRITLTLELGWQLGGERQFRLGMAMRHILPMSIDANRSAYPHIFAHYPHHSAFAASAWPLVPYLDGIGSLDSRGRRRMQILDEEEGRRTQASKDTWQFLFNTLRWLHYSTIVLQYYAPGRVLSECSIKISPTYSRLYFISLLSGLGNIDNQHKNLNIKNKPSLDGCKWVGWDGIWVG